MTPLEFVFSIFVLLIVTLANVGGGLAVSTILVPVMMILYHFDLKSAIAISNFAGPTSALSRFVVADMREPHPLKHGKGVIIDYNIATLLLPSAILGANLGSLLVIVLPNIVILALFSLVSAICTALTFVKFCKHVRGPREPAQPVVAAQESRPRHETHNFSEAVAR